MVWLASSVAGLPIQLMINYNQLYMHVHGITISGELLQNQRICHW